MAASAQWGLYFAQHRVRWLFVRLIRHSPFVLVGHPSRRAGFAFYDLGGTGKETQTAKHAQGTDRTGRPYALFDLFSARLAPLAANWTALSAIGPSHSALPDSTQFELLAGRHGPTAIAGGDGSWCAPFLPLRSRLPPTSHPAGRHGPTAMMGGDGSQNALFPSLRFRYPPTAHPAGRRGPTAMTGSSGSWYALFPSLRSRLPPTAHPAALPPRWCCRPGNHQRKKDCCSTFVLQQPFFTFLPRPTAGRNCDKCFGMTSGNSTISCSVGTAKKGIQK